MAVRDMGDKGSFIVYGQWTHVDLFLIWHNVLPHLNGYTEPWAATATPIAAYWPLHLFHATIEACDRTSPHHAN